MVFLIHLLKSFKNKSVARSERIYRKIAPPRLNIYVRLTYSYYPFAIKKIIFTFLFVYNLNGASADRNGRGPVNTMEKEIGEGV